MTSKLLFFTLVSLLSAPAFANICGTDYQNFNPTTNGLDFVTVQSSETLKPCFINMGVFLNYAANSMTYSRTLNSGYVNGQQAHDRTLGGDLSLGFGLTDRWDVGVNLASILSQTVSDDYYVASYGNKGLTEVKLNTKYKFLGDDSWGLAGVLSMNKNLIYDNPFVGRGAGPTWNFEVAADTTIAKKWAIGVNAGYRLRDKGEPMANTPFVPLGNQYIYSAALSYLVASLDTKVIAEIYGSRPARRTDQDTDRSLNTLEGLLGVKYDATSSKAIHTGATARLENSMGGPEWRVYAGLNWAIDACGKKAEPIVERTAEAKSVEEIKIDVELLFPINSDKVNEVQMGEIDTFLVELFHRPFTRLVVGGHTDSVGPEEYNMDLSRRRAKNMRDYLVKKYKLDEGKVDSEGFGPTHPIADNGNFQGRRKNRRVELKIFRE